MLDITLFRDDKEFKKIIESQEKRFKSTEPAQNVQKYDNLWKESKSKAENLRSEKNKITKQIPILAKEGKDISSLKEQSKKIDDDIKNEEVKQEEYLKLRDENRYKVGNILLDDVPIGKSDEENVPVRFWGIANVQKEHLDNFSKLTNGKMKHQLSKFTPISHVDLGLQRDLFDLERAAKVSGSRFYYLKNKFAVLHMSLIRFAVDKLIEKGYNFLITPDVITRNAIEKAAELSDFEETLYRLSEDEFLIATAEQTLASMHMDEILDKKSLPLKYAGLSKAFRREAGSKNKDTRGIFRVHEFEKVEQYVFCLPEDSVKIHEEIIKNCEEIMQELELPYRVISICSGDMNDTAAKKYDVELWMSVQGTFREIASGSITTDYQTRKLNVRYADGEERKVVHSLNCTALPSPRILTAIIENHQDKDGIIHIPKALQKYTGFDKI